MKTKTKRIILAAVAVTLLAVAGRSAYCFLFYDSGKETTMRSPDGQFEAKLTRSERVHFWRAGDCDHCEMMVVPRKEGRVRRIVMEEPPIGWVQGSSIRWADDSSAVTFAFINDEAETKQLTIESLR